MNILWNLMCTDVYTDFMKAYEDRIRKTEKMPDDWFAPF